MTSYSGAAKSSVLLVLIGVSFLGCASANSSRSTPAVRQHRVPLLVLNTVVADSQVFRPKSAGTVFRYGSGDMRRDVFVYPKETTGDLPAQARVFIQVLELDKRRGQLDAYEVLTNTPFNMDITGRIVAAHEITMNVTFRGKPHRSYFAVVSLPDAYAKFRITRPVASTDTVVRGFVKAWTSAYLSSEN
jgi:hypothetical protein